MAEEADGEGGALDEACHKGAHQNGGLSMDPGERSCPQDQQHAFQPDTQPGGAESEEMIQYPRHCSCAAEV